MGIREIVYKLYQLDWLLQHNYSLDDLMVRMDSMRVQDEDNDYTSPSEYFEKFKEFGFKTGEVFACFNEFLQHEYLEPLYIEQLLEKSGNTLLKVEYYEDVKSQGVTAPIFTFTKDKLVAPVAKVVDNAYGIHFCSHCHGKVHQVMENSKYCFQCGAKLDWSDVQR